MEIPQDIVDEVRDIKAKIDEYGKENGYGYMTFVLCNVFHLPFPFQIRFIWDPQKYVGAYKIFDPILVRRRLEDIPTFIGAHPEVHPRCYQCGKELKDRTVQKGSGLGFFLCDTCDGKHITMDDNAAMQIHEFVKRERGDLK